MTTTADETHAKPAATNRRWLVWFGVLFAIVLLYLVIGWNAGDADEPIWFQGFKGNLVGEVVGSIVFLFLGFYLDAKVEQIQEETHRLTQATYKLTEQTLLLTAKSSEILKNQEDDREQDDRIEQFMRFLRSENETYHDVRFPDIKSPTAELGLNYTISPVRDADNKPVVRRTEMDQMYLIRIDGPAGKRVLDEQQLRDYDDADIHTGEHYFCRFYNRAWHMGRESSQTGWHKFYMSGKLGPCETGITADEFMKASGPPESVVWKKSVLVDAHGKPTDGFNGACQVTIYKDADDAIWVQPSESVPPKRFVRERNMRDDTTKLVVDHFEGYFTGAARQPFLELMAATVEEAGHKVPESRNYDW